MKIRCRRLSFGPKPN